MGDTHFFMCGRGHLSKANERRAIRIAQKHDADFVQINNPGNGLIHWFECQNRGAPFNGETARAVEADLEAADLIRDDGRLRTK